MTTHQFQNLAETRAWVRQLSAQIRRPGIVLLNGPMGAGKTQIVRWLLEDLGISETSSPTFAIHHQYSSRLGPVDHVDLYRVNSDADLESTGFWDLLSSPHNILLVEWADRLAEELWPQDRFVLSLNVQILDSGDESRSIQVSTKQP